MTSSMWLNNFFSLYVSYTPYSRLGTHYLDFHTFDENADFHKNDGTIVYKKTRIYNEVLYKNQKTSDSRKLFL